MLREVPLDANGQCDASDPSNTCENSTSIRPPLDFPLARKQWIDSAVSVKGSTPEVRSGVKFGDGDGTIPVVSLGAMCVKGWQGKTRWNPAGIPVVTQGELCPRVMWMRLTEEYRHTPEGLDIRGGALTYVCMVWPYRREADRQGGPC